MSSSDKSLSAFARELPSLPDAKISIIVSEWNEAVTKSLAEGAKRILYQAGLHEKNVVLNWVPGSYELILGAQKMAANTSIDAVIVLGCVIQGETRHFDFICDAVAHGIAQVSLKFDKPVIFGVLTTDNQEQAMERAGGKHGNKGEEAAYTALRMLQEFH
ncbi:MAG: 6,7-dimethyl-8-ribityllumazine synthase [Bacteroidetes bacterium]|nr:6,7-dimethyl-8-ribityllumazine synthase [Bacteroidota bacterium]